MVTGIARDRFGTRVTVVGFYTAAKPVVIEAFDLNVVSNVLNGLPLEHAFDRLFTTYKQQLRLQQQQPLE